MEVKSIEVHLFWMDLIQSPTNGRGSHRISLVEVVRLEKTLECSEYMKFNHYHETKVLKMSKILMNAQG